MAKFFAVTIIVIAIASAIPILRHTWVAPEDISTHGDLIDEQMSETMAEAGISFLAAQFILAFFIWKFSNPRPDAKIKNFPGGAKGFGDCRLAARGRGSPGPRSLRSEGMGERISHRRLRPTPCPSRSRPDSSRSISAIPVRMESSAPFTRNSSMRDRRISLVSIPQHDADSKDDIVTAEMAIPVNKEIHLLMHAKDVGHSFFVRELRVQQDFVPGLDVSLHFTATKVGRYEIVCTQLCGLGHYNMKAYLDVLSQHDFDDWLKKEAAMQ